MGEAADKVNMGDWNEAETSSTQRRDAAYESASFDDTEEDPEQIRAEIEDTRAEMTQTINEIQERLSPDHLMNQVKETVREATLGKVERAMDMVGETIVEVTEPARQVMGRAGETIKETGKSVADSVWRNPIPVALIGLGLGMLVMRSARRGNGYDYSRSPKATGVSPDRLTNEPQYGLRQQQSTTTNALNQVKETASDLANRSTETLNNITTKAKESASSLGTRFVTVCRENPLAVGAVAIAAGTAVGLVLPASKFENEYLSETSGMLVDKAEEVARGALEKVQDTAQQMVSQQP